MSVLSQMCHNFISLSRCLTLGLIPAFFNTKSHTRSPSSFFHSLLMTLLIGYCLGCFHPIPGRVSCLKTKRKSRSFHMESECHKWFLSLPLGLFVGFVLVLVVPGVNLTPKNSIWWQTEPNKNLEQRTWNLAKSLYFSLNPQRNPQRKQKMKTGMKCSNRYCTMNIRNKLKNH